MAGEAILANIVTEIMKKLSSFGLQEINPIGVVEKELEKLQKTILMIEAVSRDAENKQVKEKSVGIWLKELRDLVYDADDILDEYAYDQVRNSFKSSQVAFSSNLVGKIKHLNKKFDKLVKQRVWLGLQVGSSSHTLGVDASNWITRENFAFVDESRILGREVDKSKIINMLLANKSSCNRNDKISVISIVGMGGLGKTTLAQLVYKDSVVEKHFDLIIWVCVSYAFDVKKIFMNIIESITCTKFDGVSDLNVIVNQLQQHLRGRRFLLVLDDVWNEKYDEWDKLKKPLAVGAEGSKILVTTRSETVGLTTGEGEFLPYMLENLGEDICLSIFEQRAFGPSCRAIRTSNLVAIGKQLVIKCGGLPLAAKALGSLMRSKKEECEWLVIKESKIWDNIPTNPNKTLLVLRLSYDHLSSQLKQCFSYCSMFPKGVEFERETLIQLWVAEGFILPSQGDKRLIEEIGNEYFHILLWNSFFQNVKRDDMLGEIRSCRMHDLVHDLAQSVVGTHECSVMEASEMGNISKFRRLNLLNFSEESSVIASKVFNGSKNKLRTLFINYESIKNIENFFDNNKRLHVLDLSHTDIEQLPPSIGDLKHLRYLDLSWTRIKTLPDSITQLHNLQTLKLMECWHLVEFPIDLNQLINLRHLLLDKSDWQEVGQLTCLQTLNGFVVPPDIGGSCVGGIGVGGVGELQYLDLLGGELEISRLERLRGRKNAENANLKAKQYIKQLKLEWRGYYGEEDVGFITDECNNDSFVLEGLQPHPNLRSLEIHNFMGPRFPKWMSNPLCLRDLVRLQLDGCKKCEQLPFLEQLPSLQFLGLSNMLLLVDWLERPLPLVDMSSSSSVTTSSFPSLESLSISGCPRLKSMPTLFPSLTKLSIKDVGRLKFLPQGLLKNNDLLRTLDISGCSKFRGFIEEGEDLLFNRNRSNSLQELMLCNCPVLTLLPRYLDLRSLTSLRKLSIINCGKLSIRLCESIEMSDCPMLKSMPTFFPFMEELVLNNCNDKIVNSVLGSNLMDTLTFLWLENIPRLMFLPQGLLKDSNVLQSLHIYDCLDFEGFIPEEDEDLLLNNSSSLQMLVLYNCPFLRLLPDLMGLTSLQYVTVQGCNKQLLIVLPNGLDNRFLQHNRIPQLPYFQTLEKFTVPAHMIEANLNIKRVALTWTDETNLEEDPLSWSEEIRPDADDSLVLECLLPHPSLRGLVITGFMVLVFPKWMSDPLFLPNLVQLELHSCNRCEQLPALGKLPFLRLLIIRGMIAIKCIGKEFYLGGGGQSILLSEEAVANTTIAFPSLKELILDDMPNLEEWVEPLEPRVSFSPSTSSFTCFPLLESIEIKLCPKLKSMPTLFPALVNLEFYSSNGTALSSTVRSNLDSLTSLYIEEVTKLVFLPQGLLINNNVLQSLDIYESPDFQGFNDQEEWRELFNSSSSSSSSLQSLTILDCPVLTFIPGISGMTSLQRLTILDCNKEFDILPNDLECLSSLEELEIGSSHPNEMEEAKE